MNTEPATASQTGRLSTASSHARTGWRVVLAGPLALIATCAAVLGGAVWLPPGPAQVDNLVLPVVLFPLLWAAVFLYACVEPRLLRGYAIVGTLILVNLALVIAS